MYQFHQEQHSYIVRAAEESMLKSARARAKSWVMISPSEEAFVKLPNEKILYTSPTRTSLLLSSTNSFPGTQPWSVQSDSGIVYVTNQRIVYMPTQPSAELENFSSPILNLQDTYVRAPFFGANYWTASVRPVAGGGIPPNHAIVELKLTFREGGAFDYHTVFEQIKERLHYALSLAREEGRGIGGIGPVGAAELAAIHLEQLPAYEPAQETIDGVQEREPPATRDSGIAGVAPPSAPKDEETFTPPTEPPPGYEEAQAQALEIGNDRRLRNAAERE